MRASIEQTVKLILTQRQQQSLRILGMSAGELGEFLSEQAIANPLVSYEAPTPLVLRRVAPCDAVGDADRDGFLNLCDERHRAPTLQSLLFEQLNCVTAPKPLLASVRFLIKNVDSRGYLDLKTDEIARLRKCSREEACDALRILQAMDPAGVGARSLRECLLLQLKRQEPQDQTAMRLVRDHISAVARGNIHALAATLHLPQQEVLSACEHIRALNPKPGNGFASDEDVPYAPPDLLIEADANDTLSIRLNPEICFSFRVDEAYLDGLTANAYSSEARAFLRDSLETARLIAQGVQRRESTLLLCGREILKLQYDFFAEKASSVAPCTMLSLATTLGVSASTVTRALKNKTLLCARGTFPLSAFFCRHAYQTETVSVSAAALRQRIAVLIASEDPRSPLSDQSIVDWFEREAISISRRAVAKYRAEMNLPASYARKRA